MKVSVVTINYNNTKGLERTIQSVIEQNFPDLEYIIIDGSSTDGSTEVIRKFSDNIHFWSSEPDRGVYDAQNKGIQKATGDYILFLNSGDYFFSYDSVYNLVTHGGNADIIYGDIILALKGALAKQSYPVNLDFTYFHNNTLPHPCTLIKKELFSIYGLYKEELRISADWAFFLDSIAKHNRSYKHIDYCISVFNVDGISSSQNSQEIIKKEKKKYFLDEYAFFDLEHESYMRARQKIDILRSSRYLKIISRMLPARLRKVIYD